MCAGGRILFMNLPVMPPIKPMLAKAVGWEVLEGIFEREERVQIEPKWDGFRSIIFRDGDDVEIGSRNEKPMTRYFPDIVEAVKAALPDQVRGRRRDRRTARRPAGVRDAAAANPPGRVAGPQARRRDTRRSSSASTCSRSATTR